MTRKDMPLPMVSLRNVSTNITYLTVDMNKVCFLGVRLRHYLHFLSSTNRCKTTRIAYNSPAVDATLNDTKILKVKAVIKVGLGAHSLSNK